MKNVLNRIKYDLYLLVFVILTFFSFTGHIQTYYLGIMMFIGMMAIASKLSILYVIPIPFFIQMSFSDLRDDVTITTMYSVILLIIIVVDVMKNRKMQKLGYLFLPLSVFSLLSIITHFNGPDLFTTFAGFMQIASILGLYYYFVNTVEPGKESFKNVSKLFMYMSILVTLEMVFFIYESGDLAIQVIRSRSIDLGWENLNIIVYVNIVAIPMIAYLVHQSKIKVPYMLFAVVTILGIMLTLSRSSLLTIGVFVVFLVPVMFLIEKRKVMLVIQGLIFLAIFMGALYYAEKFELVSQYIEAIQSRDLAYFDDRLRLLEIAMSQFKNHPIFGAGGLYSSRVHLAETGALNYHNTIAQASTLGSLGLVTFIWIFIRKTRIILRLDDSFKWFVLILIYVTTFVNGMLQPMYFYTSYMVFIFLVLAIVEVNINPFVKTKNKIEEE